MIKRLFSSQLRINMASGVVVTVISTVTMMAAFPIYLHFLGYEKYGVWLVLATVLSFAQLGNLGIGHAVMKLVAEEHGRDDIESIQKYVMTAISILLISGSIALAVILVFKGRIVGLFKLSDANAQKALWLLPYIGILSIYVFIVQALNATLSGLGRMDLANYAQALGGVFAVSIATLMLYRGNGIVSILVGNSFSYIFVHVVSLICIWRIAHIRLLRLRNLDAKRGKRILRFGGAVFGGSVISMLFSPFNKLMLSRYAGVATIPVYEIAFRASMQVRGLAESGLRALMPEISRINANLTTEGCHRILQITRKTKKIIFLAGGPFCIVIFLFAHPLLKFWLQERFVSDLATIFRVMLLGTCFSLMAPLAYYVLLGFGKAASIFFTSAIRALCNLLLVSIVVVVSGTLTVEQVSFCVLLSWVLSTLFIAYRARCVLSAFALATQSRGNGDEKRNMLGSTWIRRSVN